jgi:hypothetical protein
VSDEEGKYTIPLPEEGQQIWRRQLPEFELLIYQLPGERAFQRIRWEVKDRFGEHLAGTYDYKMNETVLTSMTTVVKQLRDMLANWHLQCKEEFKQEGGRLV